MGGYSLLDGHERSAHFPLLGLSAAVGITADDHPGEQPICRAAQPASGSVRCSKRVPNPLLHCRHQLLRCILLGLAVHAAAVALRRLPAFPSPILSAAKIALAVDRKSG